jgi:hypothetical protein
MSSDEFLPVASGGSFVITRLGNKVGNGYPPPGGDLSFSAIGYEPLAASIPSLSCGEPLPGAQAHLIRLLAIRVKNAGLF